jgi:hypothetical protein
MEKFWSLPIGKSNGSVDLSWRKVVLTKFSDGSPFADEVMNLDSSVEYKNI